MFSVIFASAVGLVLVVVLSSIRQKIRVSITGQTWKGILFQEHALMLFPHDAIMQDEVPRDEIMVTPIYVDGVTPFHLTNRGNLQLGPAIPGANMDYLGGPFAQGNLFQSNNPFRHP